MHPFPRRREVPRTPAVAVAVALVAFLFGSNVYRAATQPIVHDEALTWRQYLNGPASLLFSTYDANHHVLNTYLCKLTTSLFGVNELAMRLPSLAGGLLYLASAFFLCLLVDAGGWRFLLTLAFVILHPFVLDFLSVARGYGLASGCFLFALFHLARYLGAAGETRPRPSLWWAAVGAACSVAASFTAVFPVTAVSLLFLIGLARAPKTAAAPARKKAKRAAEDRGSPVAAALLEYALPAVVLLWLLVSGPVAAAQKGSFYVGAATLGEMARALAEVTFAKTPARHPWLGAEAVRNAIGLWVAPLLLAACAALAWRPGRAHQSPGAALRFLAGAAAPALLLLLGIAHLGAGLLYPEARTGLYWFPLAGLACGASLHDRWLRAPCLVFLGAGAVLFAQQFSVGPYFVWPYDGAGWQVLERIRERQTGMDRPVSIGCSWQLEPALNFHRERPEYRFVQPVMRQVPLGPYDYYLLLPQDRAIVERLHLQTLWTDPVGGVTLAAPAQPSSSSTGTGSRSSASKMWRQSWHST